MLLFRQGQCADEQGVTIPHRPGRETTRALYGVELLQMLRAEVAHGVVAQGRCQVIAQESFVTLKGRRTQPGPLKIPQPGVEPHPEAETMWRHEPPVLVGVEGSGELLSRVLTGFGVERGAFRLAGLPITPHADLGHPQAIVSSGDRSFIIPAFSWPPFFSLLPDRRGPM